jgi:hypothetical protein
MGRPRKYHTPEESLLAHRRRQKSFDDKNREYLRLVAKYRRCGLRLSLAEARTMLAVRGAAR